jgi:type VII secretion ATPase EccA
MTAVAVDRHAVELFAASCAYLGVEVRGRTQIPDRGIARDGFTRLTQECPDQCDGWRGRAAAGDASAEVLAQAYRTRRSCGDLVAAVDATPTAVDWMFDSGMYVALPAVGADGLSVAYAASLTTAGKYSEAKELLDDRLLAAQPVGAVWVLAVTYFRAGRWHDVRRVLEPLLGTTDPYVAQAVSVAYGRAGAHLGMWEPALDLLTSRGRGPVPAATAEALLVAGLCARALNHEQDSKALLNEAYGVAGADEDTRRRITAALAEPNYGIFTTSPSRIDARTDFWDPATEPNDREHARQLAAHRREEVRAEAEEELAGFVGMQDAKDEIDRLESSVIASQIRAAKGYATPNRKLHIVIKGPPGTGKTSLARVIVKKNFVAGVLPTETFVEVTRGDLVAKVIGGSEDKVRAKLRQVIEAGGGGLFIDEAYLLTSSGSENDFGPLVIGELLTATLKYADILQVIVAGYPEEMDEFLNSNPGLASRFAREIVLPSYRVEELNEISDRYAAKRDSLLADRATLRMIFERLAAAEVADPVTGRARRALDLAGNARFCTDLVEFSEEERDHRLRKAGRLTLDGGSDDEDLKVITGADLRPAAMRLLKKYGVPVSENIFDPEGSQR